MDRKKAANEEKQRMKDLMTETINSKKEAN
jgi:hypothetical protein